MASGKPRQRRPPRTRASSRALRVVGPIGTMQGALLALVAAVFVSVLVNPGSGGNASSLSPILDGANGSGGSAAAFDRAASAALVGALHPRDLPGPAVFRNFHTNSTLTIPGDDAANDSALVVVPYWEGSVPQINGFEVPVEAEVVVLPTFVPREVVREMLSLLREYGDDLDDDPDTVDAMPTYEIFVDSVELRDGSPTLKIRDADASDDRRRRILRARLQELAAPHAKRLTAAVRRKYPEQCGGLSSPDRACTACYSLVRRYRDSDRQTHAAHHDGHARVTAVVSLSDYGTDYAGGLYVATGHGMREYLALNAGDAALHQSTLLHGVHVFPPEGQENGEGGKAERWSWIIWFRDSVSCEDHSSEWFAECAEQGNALCQQLHASKVVHGGGDDEKTLEERSRKVLRLNVQAAHGGAGEAAVKVARAYLKTLPSELEFDAEQAKRYFRMAIEAHSPEGHYGMAQILVAEAATVEAVNLSDQALEHDLLRQAVGHLEDAARQRHAFAAFNLGLAHVFGYGIPVNVEAGVEWFCASGLPEGYFLAAQYAATIGDAAKYDEWSRRARVLGMDRSWRPEARHHTGSGGAAGVDLNLFWPPSEARGGMHPPKF